MKFFSISILADRGVDGFCFTDNYPVGIGASSYQLSTGVALGDEYGADVSWQLDDAHRGLKKPSLLGNTNRILAVHREVADVIRIYRVGEIEILPFTLLNHRCRVHSNDYVFVNPLGSIDCLHLEKSSITRLPSGKVFKIDAIVLDEQKLTDPLDLFRIREQPREYVISERLANAFAEKRFTNLFLTELPRA